MRELIEKDEVVAASCLVGNSFLPKIGFLLDRYPEEEALGCLPKTIHTYTAADLNG
jgi:hypothetical protein